MSHFRILFTAAVIVLLAMPVTASAKRGDDDRDRRVFKGIIQSMPADGFHGEWIIGDYAITTVPGTEFDQDDGPLSVNGCAKVEFRNGVLHEIDSEPLSDCR